MSKLELPDVAAYVGGSIGGYVKLYDALEKGTGILRDALQKAREYAKTLEGK